MGVIEAPNIILAIGQSSNLEFPQDDAKKIDIQDGFIKVADDSLSTGVEGVFAGGDAATGPDK